MREQNLKIKQLLYSALATILLLVFTACSAPSSSLALKTPSIPPASSQAMKPQTQIASSASLAESAISFDAPKNWQETLPKGVVGGWSASTTVGSGYTERYLFQKDGTFYFAANQYNAGDRLRYMDGDWRFENGMVTLIVKRKVIIEGGTYVEGEAAVPAFNAIEGGQYVQVELPEGSYETMDLSLELVPVDEELKLSGFINAGIILGDLQLYEKGGIPYDELLTLWEYYGSL